MGRTMRGLLKTSRSPFWLHSVIVLLLFICIAQASAHWYHHHGYSHHPKPRYLRHLNERELGDCDQVIQDALKQRRVANKYRLDHLRFNRYEFKDSSTKISVSSNSHVARATASPSSVPKNTKESNATVYSVSSDVADAARKLAESQVQTAADESARSVIEQLKSKYWAHNNDTNKPEKEQPTFDGLLKRDSAVYWMEEMEMNGASPYAPDEYKVFRNVKDYGAVGDGTTDDTEAINLAISDGDRCGAACGSSTIRPAVVYFPKGAYLVSSSIIQTFCKATCFCKLLEQLKLMSQFHFWQGHKVT
ncbi:pectate lyase superfamily protein-domain-containing protein [Aspergillus fruticulosus]